MTGVHQGPAGPPLPAFARWVAQDVPLIGYALTGILTAAMAFGVRATPHQVAAVAVIAQAVVTLVTAVATRPVRIPLVTGATGTILTAATAFGLHLSAAQTGALVPALAAILPLLIRVHVSPAVPAKAASPP